MVESLCMEQSCEVADNGRIHMHCGEIPRGRVSFDDDSVVVASLFGRVGPRRQSKRAGFQFVVSPGFILSESPTLRLRSF